MAGLTEAEVSKLRDEFLSFHQEGDGTISTEELATVLRSFGGGVNESVVQNIITSLDADGSGTIGLNEFLLMMAQKGSSTGNSSKDGAQNMQKLIRKAFQKRQKIRKTFESFDKVVAILVKY